MTLTDEEHQRLLEDWTGFDGRPDAPLSQSVVDMRRLLAAYAALKAESERLRSGHRFQCLGEGCGLCLREEIDVDVEPLL